MSLEELLSDTENSAAWKGQRKNLIRIILGIFVFAIIFVGGVAVLYSINSSKKKQIQSEKLVTEANAKSLAQLMQLKNEAAALRSELNELRNPTFKNKVTFRTTSNKRHRTEATQQRIVSFDPGNGFESVTPPQKEIYIPIGAVFQARLITPIKTSLNRTFVMAETTHEFRMDMKRKIPFHSRLVGRSWLDQVLKGVTVEFDTLVLPNGIETRLSGLALSRNALPEIEGLYFSNDLTTYGTALAFGFLSGFAGGAQQREITPFGSSPAVSLSNQMLAGLSTASFQVAENMLNDISHRSVEYVVVPAGEQIFVALTRRYDIDQDQEGKPKP